MDDDDDDIDDPTSSSPTSITPPVIIQDNEQHLSSQGAAIGDDSRELSQYGDIMTEGNNDGYISEERTENIDRRVTAQGAVTSRVEAQGAATIKEAK